MSKNQIENFENPMYRLFKLINFRKLIAFAAGLAGIIMLLFNTEVGISLIVASWMIDLSEDVCQIKENVKKIFEELNKD